MNSLNDTIIFKEAEPLMDVLKAAFNTANIQYYLVDPELYDYCYKIFKNYKYSLSKVVVDYGNKNKIQMVLYGEPKDIVKNNPLMVPSYFFSFVMPDKKLGKVGVANISPRAKYTRNKIDNSIESLKMNERDMYAYLQSATVSLLLNEKADSLNSNSKFVKQCAEIYSILLAKCLDRNYPFGAERDSYTILTFLCAVFFFQSMFGFDEEKAVNYAMTLKIISKSVVETQCKTFDENLTMKTIEDLIKAISREFTFIRKDSIQYRNLVLMYTRMYGQNSIFAIEHFGSFLNMIELSALRLGMFNDLVIDQVSKTYVKNIETILYETSGL
jgi:hypothetical protein